ncbi:hypothetical protein F5Y19DRAFT_493206 [Xylariaceae sp. FL1651]|nr:hypothetical protein F5Y19DRAFT_493206 [Xylariaceae sp. FL1651]
MSAPITVGCSNANEGFAAFDFDPIDGKLDVDVLKSCTACDSKARKRCPICGTWYCDQICYSNDWSCHKTLCKASKEEFAVSKCRLGHVRAIIFPLDSNKPSWVWVNLEAFEECITKTFGINLKEPRSFLFPRDLILVKDINKELAHRKIGHGIRQFTSPSARVPGSNINQSIVALASPGHMKIHFGHAIFFGFRTAENDGITRIYYEDATLRDLRMIVDWYLTRLDNPCIANALRFPTEIYNQTGSEAVFWPAVKLNCEGDVHRLSQLCKKNQPIYPVEAVLVLSKDALGRRFDCPLAQMAGLSWVVQPCSGTYDSLTDQGNLELLPPIFSHWNGPIFGWPLPRHFDATYGGTILVMHKAGGYIDMGHVACFHDFVEYALSNFHLLSKEYQKEQGPRRVFANGWDIKKLITKEGFEAYWQAWKKELAKVKGDLAADEYISPYNTRDGTITIAELMKSYLEQVTEEEARKAYAEAEGILG